MVKWLMIPNAEQEQKIVEMLTEVHRAKTSERYDVKDVQELLPNLGTFEIQEIVRDLEQRGFIHASQVVHDGPTYREPEWFWREGRTQR